MPRTYHYYEYGLGSRSKKLRANMTRGEVILWTRLRRRQLGVRFRRQKPIAGYIVDFFCPTYNLAIEVDGATHLERAEQDALRDEHLARLGVVVIRFSDEKVLCDEDTVVAEIEIALSELSREIRSSR